MTVENHTEKCDVKLSENGQIKITTSTSHSHSHVSRKSITSCITAYLLLLTFGRCPDVAPEYPGVVDEDAARLGLADEHGLAALQPSGDGALRSQPSHGHGQRHWERAHAPSADHGRGGTYMGWFETHVFYPVRAVHSYGLPPVNFLKNLKTRTNIDLKLTEPYPASI